MLIKKNGIGFFSEYQPGGAWQNLLSVEQILQIYEQHKEEIEKIHFTLSERVMQSYSLAKFTSDQDQKYYYAVLWVAEHYLEEYRKSQ